MGFLSFAMWLISVDQITVEVLTKQNFTVEVQTESKKPAAQAPARRKKHCIVMVSAEWCGPCRNWKRDKKKILEDLGYEVRIIDSDKRPDWKKHASSLPTFWIVDYETWSLKHKITGAVSPESIAAKADSLSVETVIKQKPNGDIETKTSVKHVPMSHQDRVRLHNQLHGGGSWSWPGNLGDHLQNVHGVETR